MQQLFVGLLTTILLVYLKAVDAPPLSYLLLAGACLLGWFCLWYRNHPTKSRIRLFEAYGDLSGTEDNQIDLYKHPLLGVFVGPNHSHIIHFGIGHDLPDRKIEGIVLSISYPTESMELTYKTSNWSIVKIFDAKSGLQTIATEFFEPIPKRKPRYAKSVLSAKFKRAGAHKCEYGIAGTGFDPFVVPFTIELKPPK